MKRRSLVLVLTLILFVGMLSSCDYNVAVNSKYEADGSLGRTITLSKVDSEAIDNNMFGINKRKGWDVTASGGDSIRKKIKERDVTVSFFKKFSSIEEANNEMNNANDTLFHIKSDIEKRHDWFYTYEKFTDTYASLNRFRYLSQDDYFTQEDFAFIDRLPAEGQPISKADSFYLDQLNTRIGDHFAVRAFYEEGYKVLIDIMKENKLEERWLDTLAIHKEELFARLSKDFDEEDNEYIFSMADTLGIPLPYPKAKESYAAHIKDNKSRMNFITDAYSGKYVHSIEAPGQIIETNADSVSGNVAYWKPAMIKFLMKDYSMYAETRSLNYWAVLALMGIIAVTLFLFIRARRN